MNVDGDAFIPINTLKVSRRIEAETCVVAWHINGTEFFSRIQVINQHFTEYLINQTVIFARIGRVQKMQLALQEFPVFGTLAESDRKRLSCALKCEIVEPGVALQNQGAIISFLFLLIEGVCICEFSDTGKKSQATWICFPGEILTGLFANSRAHRSPYNIRTLTRCTVSGAKSTCTVSHCSYSRSRCLYLK